MADDSASTPHDPSRPHIEDRRVLRWLEGDGVGGLPFSREDTQAYRPSLRPPVPVVTILDDGSQNDGEHLRMRTESLAIGRTKGDLQIPNDPALSGLHAEIRRVAWRGGYQWTLVDLQSVNGTFVRCSRAVLHDDAIVIIGSKRYRLRNPLTTLRTSSSRGATQLIDEALPPERWPVFMETSQRGSAWSVPLKHSSATLGRTGGDADIMIDDPLLAHRHAQLEQQRDGTWVINAETTRNGVWVSVNTVTLTGHCFFRCGEQIFRFELP